MKPRTKTVLRFAAIFLVGLLVGAGYVQSQAPSGTFYISQGVYPGAPSYTVWKEGSTYFAKDAYGKLFPSVSGSSNASYIINSAFSGLTAGRTWKEKVCLKGIFYVDLGSFGTKKAALQIPDYTILQIDGRIILNNGQTTTGAANNYVISNADHSGGNQFIEIRGGEVDANKAGNPGKEGEIYGIEINNSHDVIIDGVYVHDTHETGIAIEGGCYNVWVQNNHVVDTGYDGIGCGGFGAINYKIWFTNNLINGSIPHNAIVVERENYDVHIIGNTIEFQTSTSYAAGIYVSGAYKIDVSQNIIRHTIQTGIRVDGDSTYVARDILISLNIISDCQYRGIDITRSSTNITVYSNRIINTTGAYNSGSGIVLRGLGDGQGDPTFNFIFGNYITHSTAWGIIETTAPDYNYIIGNTCLDNEKGGIFQNGTNTIVHACWNDTEGWVP
jgi:hypothetical protein